jgi:hypothetical protein
MPPIRPRYTFLPNPTVRERCTLVGGEASSESGVFLNGRGRARRATLAAARHVCVHARAYAAVRIGDTAEEESEESVDRNGDREERHFIVFWKEPPRQQEVIYNKNKT